MVLGLNVLDDLVAHAVVLDDLVELECEVGLALGEASGHEVLTKLAQLPFFVILAELIMAKIIGEPLGPSEGLG